jgi:hypothetical protein
MSFVWMQYDEPRTHRPFEPQSPEQQSVFDEQVLLAVTHADDGESGWHVPPVQLPEQQALPSTGHAAPTVRHWALPHFPEMQAPLQQSVLPTHAAVAGAQVAIDEAHVPAWVSHIPEQHEAPKVQAPPNAVQSALTAPSGAKLTVSPSPAAAPSPAAPPSDPPLGPLDFDGSDPHAATMATSAAGIHA